MNGVENNFFSGRAYIEGQTDFSSILAAINSESKNSETRGENHPEKIDKQIKEEINTSEKQIVEKTRDTSDLDEIRNKLEENGYIASNTILYTIKNALLLNMPILIEGEPGVGKTSLAKAFAAAYDMELIKIQFYDGITNSDILYEYDYSKQMLYMNAIRDNISNDLRGLSPNEALEKLSSSGVNFFGENFLIQRPLLKAISGDKRKVLLLDEIDKTSEETEYLLLEILGDYTITIPEYGTVKCNPDNIPVVFLTSNNYRELSDTLKRRCLYLYIEPKTVEESKKIIAAKANVSEEFAKLVASKIEEIRKLNLKQKPSISDSINWAITLMNSIGIDAFDDNQAVAETLGTILKNKADIDMVKRTNII